MLFLLLALLILCVRCMDNSSRCAALGALMVVASRQLQQAALAHTALTCEAIQADVGSSTSAAMASSCLYKLASPDLLLACLLYFFCFFTLMIKFGGTPLSSCSSVKLEKYC